MYFDFSGSKTPSKIPRNMSHYPADEFRTLTTISFENDPEVCETGLEISVFSRSSFIWPDESLKPPFEYRNVIFSFCYSK